MDTIVAIATPPGRSAIGLIRISGPSALPLLRELLCDKQFNPDHGHAVLRGLKDPLSEELIDRALVSYFKAPRSFTGDDIVEISCHGSPVVLRQAIDALLRLGARLAEPGEFSLRALANGKINLSQAEAIRDLINAQTDAAARQAIRQLSGELSNQLQPIKDRLMNALVRLESAVEFVEDDLPPIEQGQIKDDLLSLAREVASLASTFSAGRVLRDGVRITLVGRPNTGKSSLFNTLLGLDRSIVTDIAGTTRDTVSESVNISGLPVLLTDTAGLSDSEDRLERIGVQRTKRAIAEADLLVVVVDGSADLTNDDREFLQRTADNTRVVALNKCDLTTYRARLSGKLNGESKVVRVSAKTGEGLDELREAVLERFSSFDANEHGLLITDARHYDLLCRAASELESAITLLSQAINEELVLVGLHNAMRFLDEITGETTTGDLLAQIFSTFCIGK